MTEDRRTIDLSIEVAGTPEEVWRAIATGPGISSWYVPHTLVEEAGGAAQASFGDGPEMQVAGRVAAWEPPRRIVFDAGDPDGLALEWLIEARDGGSCVVRLVNSGFRDGAEWDAQYDAMKEGWGLFLANLQLHLEHFRGESATPMLPMGVWPGSREVVWQQVLASLQLPGEPAPGDVVTMGPEAGPHLTGRVLVSRPGHLSLLLEEPARGTGFVAVEPMGPAACGVSVWAYLYGADAPALVARDKPRWAAFLAAPGTTPSS